MLGNFVSQVICNSIIGPINFGPLNNVGTPNEIVKRVFTAVFSLAGVVATGIVVAGGYKMLTAQGDSNKVKEGTDTIVNGIVGLIIIFLSVLIINFVLKLLGVGGVFDLNVLL